jgi:hypothetical protein
MKYYQMPFYLSLAPGEQVTYRGFIINDEPDIPVGSYSFEEWYCPNPACDCRSVLLYVFARDQHDYIAQIRVPLDVDRLPPFLEPNVSQISYAQALLKLLTENINTDPDYLQRLRDHYKLVKTAAADPTHPAFPTITHWATTGKPIPKTVQKHRRKKR